MSDEETKKPDDEPKIIVDDDWKEQVEKEKSGLDNPVEVAESGSTTEPAMGEMPPASFDVHLSMLFTQCMAALGQVPDPSGQTSPVNKSYAKHFIDTVEMLGEKTKGNLTDDESKMVSEILHAMRMAYVGVK